MEKGKNLSSLKYEAAPSLFSSSAPYPGLINLELREYDFFLDDLIWPLFLILWLLLLVSFIECFSISTLK